MKKYIITAKHNNLLPDHSIFVKFIVHAYNMKDACKIADWQCMEWQLTFVMVQLNHAKI